MTIWRTSVRDIEDAPFTTSDDIVIGSANAISQGDMPKGHGSAVEGETRARTPLNVINNFEPLIV